MLEISEITEEVIFLDAQFLIEAKGLKKYFSTEGTGLIKKNKGIVHAVDGIDLIVRKGETVGLVGESGCGKSTLGRLILRLIEPTAGELFFEGQNLYKISGENLRQMRKKMQIIFQDPYASLNPRMPVADIIGEPLITHGMAYGKEKEHRVMELMKIVGLRPYHMKRYPHQFSGGQRQRIGIARALALNPELVVCDEPVSALDVSIQSQVLNLLKDLQQKFNLTYIFISHDLRVVKYISDRVYVMFLGKIVESGKTRDIYNNPLHPYTRFLMSAVPEANPHIRDRERVILEGDVPSPINPPSGCRFHTRCPMAKAVCGELEPPQVDMNGHFVACHRI
ncbi:dipeptide ABC transporter ATP-binding protein [Biomaibacter acetigenes]|uniref:Dipeptide ABC transporter ATP-binding protein n=1 Tax=Biomaibacter acetigenes TaxID=2316383 RepID=A0A3G2R360_9FIRM|nr:dipeptide ABC transporter ATP-binding protein [Biomaibacter acetigenes]RKL61460.1 dipeptide ABC transporter ATP-binding protein [Thermoanaerobacteraceae bacterium SP2]